MAVGIQGLARKLRGKYLYHVWRDPTADKYPMGQFTNKEALYKAYPNLKGHLNGWP